MPYVVFMPFSVCSEVHESHSRLEDAAACLAEMTRLYSGDIPLHPVTQKYVYAIAAVDKNDKQIDFSDAEKTQAAQLNLDPKSLITRVPRITTFSHIAKMYYEASKLIPIASINLEGILDSKNEGRHFWTTDAGIGQALAYAQQAAFTLELSFKALLEVLGKLAETDGDQGQRWRTHNLLGLFKLLPDEERRRLEQWWNHSDAKGTHFNGTFREFLSYSNKVYTTWRYIADLRSADLSISIQILLSGAAFLLSSSDSLLEERSPIKVQSTFTTHAESIDASGDPIPPTKEAFVEGRVRSVRVPEGFDPFSIVEVIIDSDHHQYDVTAQFYKRNVKDYYGLEGKRVRLTGYTREDESHLLKGSQHLDHWEELPKEPSYVSEDRTLRGSVYDLKASPGPFGPITKFNLVLYDKTFFTLVECFFLTDEEREKLKGVSLGDEIMISGCVTLLDGEPVILVRPDLVEQVTE